MVIESLQLPPATHGASPDGAPRMVLSVRPLFMLLVDAQGFSSFLVRGTELHGSGATPTEGCFDDRFCGACEAATQKCNPLRVVLSSPFLHWAMSVSPNLVYLNIRKVAFHDFWDYWKVAASTKTSECLKILPK